jgi:hypothetical protein
LFPEGAVQPAWIADARLTPYVEALADWLVSQVPPALWSMVRGE